MCKSKAEGGQRCDSHIKESKDNAKKRFDKDSSDKNKASYEKALKDYVLTDMYVEELEKRGKKEEAEKARRMQDRIAPHRKLFSLAVQERMKHASNPETHVSMQAVLTKDPSFNVRRELAKASQNIKVLHQLAKDEDTRVNHWVSRNPHTDPRTLTRLYNTGDPQHIMATASNPNCPASLYEGIVKADISLTARAIAQKDDCPLSLLEKLATHRSHWVKHDVAKHPRYIEAHSTAV